MVTINKVAEITVVLGVNSMKTAERSCTSAKVTVPYEIADGLAVAI